MLLQAGPLNCVHRVRDIADKKTNFKIKIVTSDLEK